MSIRRRTWIRRGIERSAWVVDYFDQTGKRHIKTFRTRKEADNWAVTARHEVRLGTHTAARTSITVAKCFEQWIEHCEAEDLEFGTIRQRRQHLRLHVAPFIGREKLSDLTTPRIHKFDAELRDAGRSIAMRRKVLTNLKTAISFAQGRGEVAQNVARGVSLRKEDGRGTLGPLRAGIDFPTKAELHLMIDKVREKDRALIATAIFTGMRISELRGLPWCDVDLVTGTIHVRQRADAWGRIGAPKSKAGSRDIPLAPMVVNALRLWRPSCPAGKIDLVFPNRHGRVQTLQNLRERVFVPLQKSCCITIDGEPTSAAKYGFHALRHAAASLFIAHLGWTPKRVQTVMGHSSIRMTYDLYGHLFEDPEADREAMKKIEAAVVAA
jgi:integrase